MHFENDYHAGAHPKVMEKLVQYNGISTPGYGNDMFCDQAKELIQTLFHSPEAEVFFVTGGTQANIVVLSTYLKPYQGVITAKTGHIAQHETGAIEGTGHSIISLEQVNGKISAKAIQECIEDYHHSPSRIHRVDPGAVYLSFSTECGTVYTLEELKAISIVCRQYGILLYIDGARLGYGLMSSKTQISLSQLALLCDVFTIGGTKNGAMMGEAIVIPHSNHDSRDIHYMIKRQGALLAQGKFLGIQFLALLEDEFYFCLAQQVNEYTQQVAVLLKRYGYELYFPVESNQIFVKMPLQLLEFLGKNGIKLSLWSKEKESVIARFCISWATCSYSLEEIESILKKGSDLFIRAR